ncbi:hypothetical protein ED733_006381 [Metarhizium rileyi]|uniref:6-phosphogluconate dehydrogenase NADP-binding domain-containing protein n=1 Tax=Metarhizium rileyi (strain RCEF 4871) TaxID=1649241 RepID=A0A5C6GDJ7_METRR|nr:hypothetical protein ED733_006381 [Metarhizium rileyi]
MCKNIVAKGKLSSPLLLYNRSSKKAVDLAAKLPAGRAEVIASLKQAISKADIIFTCVADDDAVQHVFSVMLQTSVSGKLFIDCSTIHPDTTKSIAKDVTDAGGEFVAAPVFGAPAMADTGQLIGVLAGPRASVKKARPWFKGVVARAEIDLSDQPYSRATTLKVLGNTFVSSMVEQLAEAHVVVEKSGLGTDVFASVRLAPISRPIHSLLDPDAHRRLLQAPGILFAVDLARKDARHAGSLAISAGTEMKTLEIADVHLAKVKLHCGEAGDIAGIYGAVREEAGLRFENDA